MDFELQSVPKEIIEKQFIIDFFKSLPIENLKRMINYEFLDYNETNQNLVSQRRYHLLNTLRNERVHLITADIWLDNGVDDLDFFKFK